MPQLTFAREVEYYQAASGVSSPAPATAPALPLAPALQLAAELAAAPEPWDAWRRPEPAPEGWDVTTITRTRADVSPEGRVIQGELVPFGTKLLITEQKQDEWHENVAEMVSASAHAWAPTASLLGVPPHVIAAIKLGAAALAPEPEFPVLAPLPAATPLPQDQPFNRNQENLMFDEGTGFNLGGTLVGLATAYTNYRAQRAQAASVSGALALPGGVQVASLGPVMAGGAAAGSSVVRALPSFLGLGGMVSAGAGAIRSAAGRIVGFFVGGRRVSRKSAVSLAKKVGLEAGAAALGVGALELAQAVLEEEEAQVRRRSRGSAITGAQLRVTRRTIGKVERAHRQIVSFCGSARVPRRAAPARRRK